MKKSKIFALAFAVLLVLCAAACSRVEKPDATQSASATQMSEYDISQAVEAFGYMTDVGTTAFAHVEPSSKGFVFETAEKATQPSTKLITTTVPTTAASKQTVKVTVNEGDSLTQIFKKLDENGVADFDELMETAQTYDYSYYPLVAKIPESEKRCFKLEGYLFPDTYVGLQ